MRFAARGPSRTFWNDEEHLMQVRKITIADARFERSPGQDGDVWAGNVVDQRDGGPITIGYGRYGAGESIVEEILVDDVMIILEGDITATSDAGTQNAGPGEMIYMPKGSSLTITAGGNGAVTAYVTFPHWQDPDAGAG